MTESEAYIHYSCYSWFHNSYPDLRGLLCYNLSNSRNKIEGNKNKAMGLQAGRSDLVFYYHGKAYHIEVKTAEGVQSKEQKEWQRQIEAHRFTYHIIRSLEEFQNLIQNIL